MLATQSSCISPKEGATTVHLHGMLNYMYTLTLVTLGVIFFIAAFVFVTDTEGLP
jgi:hypothetical protein